MLIINIIFLLFDRYKIIKIKWYLLIKFKLKCIFNFRHDSINIINYTKNFNLQTILNFFESFDFWNISYILSCNFFVLQGINIWVIDLEFDTVPRILIFCSLSKYSTNSFCPLILIIFKTVVILGTTIRRVIH